MSNQSDTPWWQVVGAIFIAGGMVYLGHKMTEAQVDTLISQPTDEAAETIIKLAVQADDTGWSHFRMLLDDRAYTSSHAANLLG